MKNLEEKQVKIDADKILESVKNGAVSVPLGTKTFMVVMINENAEMKVAGTVSASHADEIAFWLMSQKRPGYKNQAEKGGE